MLLQHNARRSSPTSPSSQLRALQSFMPSSRRCGCSSTMPGSMRGRSGGAVLVPLLQAEPSPHSTATSFKSSALMTFFQEKLKDRSWPAWESHWKAFESLLKLATGLEDASELSEAVTIYNGVSLKNKQSVDATDQFLTDYTAARTGMIEQGLIIAHDPKSQQREFEDLKKKFEGSDVLKYLMELPDFPQRVNDLDPAKAKGTILPRLRAPSWVVFVNGSELVGDQGLQAPQRPLKRTTTTICS